MDVDDFSLPTQVSAKVDATAQASLAEPRQPCLDLFAAAGAAVNLTSVFAAVEAAGWQLAMAHGGLCWRGRVNGTWVAGASGYQGGTAREAEVMVRVEPAGQDRSTFLPEPIPYSSDDGIADRIISKLEGAFAAVPGMLAVVCAPGCGIVADRSVGCHATRIGSGKVIVVNLREANGLVAWPGPGGPAPLRRTDRDPYCWQEILLGALELCVDGGHLHRAQRLVESSRADRLTELADPLDMTRLAAARAALSAADLEEGARGEGDNVDPSHPVTLWVAERERFDAAAKQRRAAALIREGRGPATTAAME